MDKSHFGVKIAGFTRPSVTRMIPILEKKLERHEFGNLPILPTGSAVLEKDTELNVVVDPICLKDPARGAKQLPWLKDLALKVPPQEVKSHRSYQYKLEANWDFYRLQSAFESEPCVHLVSPEGKFFAFSRFNDPFQRDQSHLVPIRYEQAMSDFILPILIRPKVVIAVIDTGVDFNHEDLRMNHWRNPKEVAGNRKDDDNNGYVDDVDGYNFASNSTWTAPEGDWSDNVHGTHVAGLAASRIDNAAGGVGIAGVADIMSLNVFGANGYSRSSILENAIRYAADRHADVINMSLGGREYSRTMKAALEYAVRRGSFIVSAAGNDSVELCDDPESFDFISPAIYGAELIGMMTTGSVDAANGRYSTFSNYSPSLVEISAPGALTSQGQLIGLLSTLPGNQYGILAGTSMSAPIVSGAAGLVITWLKAYRYTASPARIEEIMKNGARRERSLTNAVQVGRVLDLSEIVRYLKLKYPPR